MIDNPAVCILQKCSDGYRQEKKEREIIVNCSFIYIFHPKNKQCV